MNDSISSSFVNEYVLHLAAATGDDVGVAAALSSDADVNALDAFGKTALLNAIGGQDWDAAGSLSTFLNTKRMNAIRILTQSGVSLLTLNGSQCNEHGVTPLGLAAWLNLYPVVELLVTDTFGTICIDGPDFHGMTPLMYAARDNSIDVCQLLLQHGARPDARDHRYVSPIQYALPHSYTLFICEVSLRRHRLQESQNQATSRLGSDSQKLLPVAQRWLTFVDSEEIPQTLFLASPTSSRGIDIAIASRNIPMLLALLFPTSLTTPPTLINALDSEGWGAIHHCTSSSVPSLNVLDLLYLAGADTSLMTAQERYTPLHTFALVQLGSLVHDDLVDRFANHLANNLRAPLSAVDRYGNTCIHLAAEHGDSRVFLALLKLDETGAVRNQTNSRGLTAFDVAKDEYRAYFGEAELLRSQSVLSQYTIRPSPSTTSVQLLHPHSNMPTPRAGATPETRATTVETLLRHLQITSLSSDPSSITLSLYESALQTVTRSADAILTQTRSRGTNIWADLSELRKSLDTMSAFCDSLAQRAATKSQERCIPLVAVPRAMGGPAASRLSEDSEKTLIGSSRSRSSSIVTQSDKGSGSRPSSSAGKKGSRGKVPIMSGTMNEAIGSKIKLWIKQKMGSSMEKLGNFVADVADEVAGEGLGPGGALPKDDATPLFERDEALRTASVVLSTSRRDIGLIRQCLDSAERWLRQADSYVNRMEKALQTAVKERRTYLELVRPPPPCHPGTPRLRKKSSAPRLALILPLSPPPSSPCPSPPSLSHQPSLASLVSSASASLSRRSSVMSLSSSAVNESDREDEDVQLIRALLLRKTENCTDKALDEMETAFRWTKVVRDVLRELSRRADLG